MQQISSKLNMYAQSVSIVNANIERIILNIILLSFGLLIFFYLFLLGNMVKNIVERQVLEVQARALTNEVRSLEVTYLSLSNNVNLTLSHSMGFREIPATFATHKALSFSQDRDQFGNINHIVQNGI